MHKKINLLLLIVLIIPFALTSCYDSMEIDDQVYPVVVGVDKGVNNKLKVTIQYATYTEGANKGKSQQPNANIHTVEGPTIIDATEMFGIEVSRKVSLKHMKFIAFSEELAKEGIGKYITGMQRYREIRSTMGVVIVAGKAEELIKENKSTIGTSVPKMMELLYSQSKNTNYFPETEFFNFYKVIFSTYDQPAVTYAGINNFQNLEKENNKSESPLITDKGFLPGKAPRSGVTKREFAGTALFYEDKMVGYLDSYETRYYLLVNGKFKKGIMSINDKNKLGSSISVEIQPSRKPKVKAYFVNGKPVIDVNLKVNADIQSIESRINYEDIHMIDDLNNQIKDFLLKGITKTIEKTQKEYGTDIFGFGQYVAGNFSTIQELEDYDWLKHYGEAKINVNLNVNIRRTGIIFDSAKQPN